LSSLLLFVGVMRVSLKACKCESAISSVCTPSGRRRRSADQTHLSSQLQMEPKRQLT
jgi:hypothetical protein